MTSSLESEGWKWQAFVEKGKRMPGLRAKGLPVIFTTIGFEPSRRPGSARVGDTGGGGATSRRRAGGTLATRSSAASGRGASIR